jgi:hypothetical protein
MSLKNMSRPKKILFIFVGVTLIVSSVVLASIVKTTQDLQTKASKGTILLFEPATSQTTPLQKKVGENISLDIMVDPNNTNLITLIRLEILYDSTVLHLTGTAPFIKNNDAFPTTLDNVNITPGKLTATISVGTDPTRAISQLTRVGTISFTTISPTSQQATVIAFGQNTEILSAGLNDQASENVLTQAIPAYITVSALPTATSVPTPTQSPTITTIPSPTTVPGNIFHITVALHGIGVSGDNSNPLTASLSNKNPQHKERSIRAEIFNNKQEIVASGAGMVTYSASSGKYTGALATKINLPASQYIIKIQTDTHLKRYIPGIISIAPSQNYTLAHIDLVAGDANTDNTLNILDYNMLRDCYSDYNPPIACTDISMMTIVLINMTIISFFAN